MVSIKDKDKGAELSEEYDSEEDLNAKVDSNFQILKYLYEPIKSKKFKGYEYEQFKVVTDSKDTGQADCVMLSRKQRIDDKSD